LNVRSRVIEISSLLFELLDFGHAFSKIFELFDSENWKVGEIMTYVKKFAQELKRSIIFKKLF